MNGYELILLFDPALGEEKISALLTKIEDKIKAGKGEVDKTEKWGAKRLASMIKKAPKLTQAFYVLIRFRSPSNLPAELKAYLKVTENVIRHFISKAVETAEVTTEKIEISGTPIEGAPLGELK